MAGVVKAELGREITEVIQSVRSSFTQPAELVAYPSTRRSFPSSCRSSSSAPT